MKVIVTGGGTAGHVTPLLAVASKAKQDMPSAQIRYIGKKFDKQLNSLVQNSNDIEKSYSIFAGKLRRFHGKKPTWYLTQPKLVLQNIRDIFYLTLGLIESLFILLFWRPNVVFVKGGYVGLPVGLAAAFLRIPIITHDSDTLPGLTNRILSKYATKIGVGQPIEYYHQYPESKLVYCGVPIASQYTVYKSKDESRKELGIDNNLLLIAVIGGSLGAVRLNEAVLSDLNYILDRNRYLYWVSGNYHFKELSESIELSGLGNRVAVVPFTNQMHNILNAANIVVSRTGATSLAELATLQKVTILVPNPLLTGGHQVVNAKAYQDKNAAIVLQEHDLKNNPELLSNTINEVLNNEELQNSLQENIKQFAVPNSAQIIASLILNVGSRQ